MIRWETSLFTPISFPTRFACWNWTFSVHGRNFVVAMEYVSVVLFQARKIIDFRINIIFWWLLSSQFLVWLIKIKWKVLENIWTSSQVESTRQSSWQVVVRFVRSSKSVIEHLQPRDFKTNLFIYSNKQTEVQATFVTYEDYVPLC